jgi:transposase
MLSAHSPGPDCRHPTHRIPGHSPRPLADFPWATVPIERRVSVRRFRWCPCLCRRQTFAERLPSVAPLYARTPTRCATTPADTGLVWGGAAGARPWSRPGVPGSRNPRLRRVRRVSLPEGPAPASIGIDDWAWRKGHRYGPRIVALQRGCPIDVLEDRAAETVATWLHAPPDVTRVARDRAAADAASLRPGAPEATQVADRFHRLTHVAAALVAPRSLQRLAARALAGRVSQRHGAVSREARAGGSGAVPHRGGVDQPLASASRTDHQPPKIGITRDQRGGRQAAAPKSSHLVEHAA